MIENRELYDRVSDEEVSWFVENASYRLSSSVRGIDHATRLIKICQRIRSSPRWETAKPQPGLPCTPKGSPLSNYRRKQIIARLNTESDSQIARRYRISLRTIRRVRYEHQKERKKHAGLES